MAKRQEIEEIEEVEGGEEEAAEGGGLEFGIVVATTLALIIGIIAGLKELGAHYGVGPFSG